MISALVVVFAMQADPNVGVVRTVPQRPAPAAPALTSSKNRMIAEGRALVTEAERVSHGYTPATGQPTKAELHASIDHVKSDLDAMSEMGEMESLRLQMAMDRLSKLMSTLSNLLKKASETQQDITQNIK